MTVTAATLPNSLLQDRSFARTCDLAAVGILLVAAVMSALTFRDYGLGWDDYTHAEYGDLLLSFYASGLADTRAMSFVNLHMYGGGFDMASALAAKILPFSLFETRRLVGALFGLTGMLAVWRTARVIGGPLAGLIALALIATCPLYIGHMYMNAKDAPFAAAMAVLLYGLVRIFLEYPKPGLAARVIFGLGLGCALGSRVLAGIDGLCVAAAMALIVAVEWHRTGPLDAIRQLGTFLLWLIPSLILAYAVLALIWPWGAMDPLNAFRAVSYFSRFFEEPWRELFGGRLILVPDMPSSYLPTLMALTLPEILLALGLTGVAGAFVAAARPDLQVNRRAVKLMIALAFLLPIVIAMITRPALYNGIRHFIFVMPPLAILGGLAGGWIADRLRSKVSIAVASAILVAGLASPVIEMMRLHPYEYTHFNRIAGGVRNAEGRYMLDYWGLSFKQASDALLNYLNARGDKAPEGGWRVGVCGPHRPVEVAFREAHQPDVQTTWEPKGAQFAIMLGVFYCRKLPAPMIAEIIRDGALYARVYDLRGVDIPALLTMPGLQGKSNPPPPP